MSPSWSQANAKSTCFVDRLCMSERSRSTRHYTCACLSACGAPTITPMHIRALKPHLGRQEPSESKFGRGCTVPECEKRRTKAHLVRVAQILNTQNTGTPIGTIRECKMFTEPMPHLNLTSRPRAINLTIITRFHDSNRSDARPSTIVRIC